jgi:hypothetical protein
MQMSGSGRFVFYAQWFLAVLLPVFIVIGRLLVGSYAGWLTVIGWIYAVPLIIVLLIPPIITRFDREARAVKSVRSAYAASSWMLWAALLVVGLAIPDQADSSESGSALTAWTGGALSVEASTVIAGGAFVLAALAWLVQLITAITGARRGRTAPTP